MSLITADFIPTDLHMDTADRLRLVADLIEFAPQVWNQGSYIQKWGDDGDYVPALSYLGTGADCDTPGCIAGWAVRFSPEDMKIPDVNAFRPGEEYRSWRSVGAVALGLDEEMSWVLFRASPFTFDPGEFADELRKLAELPEPRTKHAARAAGLRFEEDPPYEDDES